MANACPIFGLLRVILDRSSLFCLSVTAASLRMRPWLVLPN